MGDVDRHRSPAVGHSRDPRLFLCVEGVDGVGKSTLVESIRRKMLFASPGALVRTFSFPSPVTKAGILAREILGSPSATSPTPGGEGRFPAVCPQSLHLISSADRWEASCAIADCLESGVCVLCDRYVWSGQAYSIARGLDEAWACSSDYGNPVMPTHLVYLHGDPARCVDRIYAREHAMRRVAPERAEVTAKFLADVQRAYDEVLPSNNGEMRVLRVDVDVSPPDLTAARVWDWTFDGGDGASVGQLAARPFGTAVFAPTATGTVFWSL